MRKLIYIFFIGGIGINGQTGSNPNPVNTSIDMFPQTPDAAALSKFVDIPAGSYTGVADFSIPIFEIDFNGQKMPIELKYTTTGIKVGQIATRTGLGWVLNSGPSLSQQVIGFRDMTFPKPIYPNNATFNPQPNNLPHYQIALMATGLAGNTLGQRDLKPDIFTYSLLNKSGKYILNSEGTFGIPMPYNQIKITPSNYYYQTDIVDEEGNKYFFSDTYGSLKTKNTCTENFINLDFDYFDPNFLIRTIKSPTNEEIKYIYNASPVSTGYYVSSVSTQKRISISVSGLGPGETVPPESSRAKCINYTTSKNDVLDEIQFKGGKVLFTYNNKILYPRLDVKGDVYLTNIKVVNDKNEIIKSFTLSYDYFQSPGGTPVVPSYNNPTYLEGADKRLKLISVQDNLTNGIYRLEYYETYNDKVLPNRISNDQDFWGVYNGKENREKSISNSIYSPIPSNVQSPYLGADKNPDIDYGRLGNLERIIYPTGGYTKIQYEADDFELLEPEIIYDYTEQPFEYYADNVANPPERIPFTITDHPVNQEIEFKKITNNPQNTTGPCVWKLKKPDGTIESSYANGILSRNDAPGNYELWVEKDEMPAIKCYAYYRWTDFVKTPIETITSRKAGTIRISKIESIDNNGGKIERQYTYKEPTANNILPYTKSSGKNHGEELFVPRSMQQYPNGASGYYATEILASDNPGWQTATVRGKPIGYDFVQEYYIDHANPINSYRKEYTFKNEVGSTYYDPNTPLNVTWPYLGLDRGLEMEEMLFDSSNKRVKSTVNEYQFDGHFNYKYANTPIGDFSMGYGMEIIPLYKTHIIGSYGFRYATFSLENYWISLKKSTTIEYTPAGNSLQLEKNNYYSPNYKHTYLTESTSLGSKGEIFKVAYQYPQDIMMVNPQYESMQKLISKNQIYVPVITKSYTDSLVTSEIRTLYDEFNSGSDAMILPKYIYVKKGEDATAVDRRITYNAYDIKGNLTQFTLESGIPVSVIWGYNKTLPILKIEGAVYEDIKDLPIITDVIAAAENDNIVIQGQTSDQTETTLITALDAVRMNNSLKDYQITTYSYDPLVGVRSVTPPSGMREVYTYDNAKRLKEVKRMELDATGNPVYKTLKANEYHYQQ